MDIYFSSYISICPKCPACPVAKSQLCVFANGHFGHPLRETTIQTHGRCPHIGHFGHDENTIQMYDLDILDIDIVTYSPTITRATRARGAPCDPPPDRNLSTTFRWTRCAGRARRCATHTRPGCRRPGEGVGRVGFLRRSQGIRSPSPPHTTFQNPVILP